METINFPNSLNRDNFFFEVIPSVYSQIIKKNYVFSFDMAESQFSTAEFLIGILSATSLIRNKYSQVTTLELPSTSSRLFTYLENIGFFQVASIPNNNVLDFVKYTYYSDKREPNIYKPHISCITTQSNISTHQTNALKITKYIQTLLKEEQIPESWYYYKLFQLSLIQLIENFFEHNLYTNTHNCTAYYIAQRLPKNIIQVVFYDNGKGFRKRILEIIDKEKLSISLGNPPDLELESYMELERGLSNKSLLWDKTTRNSNYQAISAALKFRKGSKIPGLAVIKDFALSRGGTFFAHSGNASIHLDKNGNQDFTIYDENFSGVHFCIEIPLKK